jgi:peptide subunit release factor 1 (eRF1)
MWIQPEDEERLARLRRLRPGFPILSAYVRVEKGLALHHGHVAALMDLLKDLRGHIDEQARAGFEVEAARVLDFIRSEYVPSGQTLAIFSSQKRRLWEILALQLPLKPIARFGTKPYLAPIDAALEDNPRTAVALVNNHEARILTLVLGEIEGEYKVTDAVPGRQRQGGWSAFRYQRDRERHIATHLVHVVGSLVELDRSRGFQRLVLGGTKEATEAVATILPKSLKSKYGGSFRAEQFRGDDEVVKAALPVIESAERAEEKSLAQKARDDALNGLPAALGWDETLQCLREGRVHRLLIAEERCGTPQGDEAFELSWDSNAMIEVIHGEAAAILADNGGVAALLRY